MSHKKTWKVTHFMFIHSCSMRTVFWCMHGHCALTSVLQVSDRVCHHCPASYSTSVLQVSDSVCHHCPAGYSVLQVSDRVCHHCPASYSTSV